MVDFGAGPVLDENFDFVIDRSGDISTDSGLPELEKDLALAVAETVEEDGLGQPFTNEREEDLRIKLGLVINNDPRIDEITDLTLEQDDDNNFQLNVEIDVDAGDGPFELVIPV